MPLNKETKPNLNSLAWFYIGAWQNTQEYIRTHPCRISVSSQSTFHWGFYSKYSKDPSAVAGLWWINLTVLSCSFSHSISPETTSLSIVWTQLISLCSWSQRNRIELTTKNRRAYQLFSSEIAIHFYEVLSATIFSLGVSWVSDVKRQAKDRKVTRYWLLSNISLFISIGSETSVFLDPRIASPIDTRAVTFKNETRNVKWLFFPNHSWDYHILLF